MRNKDFLSVAHEVFKVEACSCSCSSSISEWVAAAEIVVSAGSSEGVVASWAVLSSWSVLRGCDARW